MIHHVLEVVKLRVLMVALVRALERACLHVWVHAKDALAAHHVQICALRHVCLVAATFVQ